MKLLRILTGACVLDSIAVYYKKNHMVKYIRFTGEVGTMHAAFRESLCITVLAVLRERLYLTVHD